MLYANLLLNVLYHIVMEMKIRESCLQTGTFIYKPGISITKQDFHLQTGILGLQMGFSGYYLPFLTRIYHKKAYCAFSCHNLAMYLEKMGKKSMTILTAMPFQHLNSVLNL